MQKSRFVSSPIQTTAIVDRIRGYHTALEEYGLVYDEKRIHHLYAKQLLNPDIENKYGNEIIRLIREKQTDAFVCVNDSTAADLITFLFRNGIRIPEDIRVVGFDDLPPNQYLPVPLTTIGQPVKALAFQSVRTMMDRLENPDMPARDILVKTELIVRESCGSKLK